MGLVDYVVFNEWKGKRKISPRFLRLSQVGWTEYKRNSRRCNRLFPGSLEGSQKLAGG